MTDHDRADSPDRAERAFRRAFREHADDRDFAPIQLTDLEGKPSADLEGKPSADEPGALGARRRGAWVGVAAASVALVLAVPIVGTWLSNRDTISATAGAPAAAGGAQDSRIESLPEPAAQPSTATLSGATEAQAPAGLRWESMLDVAVLVPDAWGHDFAPGPDWCAADGYQRPDAPFVDRNPSARATMAIACPEPMPDALRQTHLTWRPAATTDVDRTQDLGDGWLAVSRRVSSAVLTVEVPATDQQLADDILATAQVVDVDPRGCPVRLGDVTLGAPVAQTTATDSVVACQYADLPGDGPNLAGSVAFTGADAQAILGGLGEPVTASEPPQACTPTRDELTLRINGGEAVLRLPFDGCRPPLFDDGHARYRPSRATCAGVLTGPLWQGLYRNEELASACHP